MDSIAFFLDSRGDTIRTGVPIEIQEIPLQKSKPAREIVLGEPEILPRSNAGTKLGEGEIVGPIWQVSKTLHDNYSSTQLQFTSEPVKLARQHTIEFDIKESSSALRIRELNQDQGLTSSIIRLPAQDSAGKIWYCYGPMVSIDGNQIKEFVSPSGDVFFPRGITMDGRQRMWMNYGWGYDLCYFDGQRIHKQSNSDFVIHGTDDEGNLIVFQDSVVLAIYGDSIRNLCKAFWFDQEIGRCIADPLHGLFIPGAYGYWGVLKNDTLTSFNLMSKSGRINSIAKQKHGSIWFGCENGLYKLDSDTLKKFSKSSGLSGTNIIELLNDKKDRLWISYENGAIDLLVDNTVFKIDFRSYRPHKSVYFKAQRIFYLDRENRVWIYDSHGSLYVLDETFLRYLQPSLPDSDHYFTDLVKAKNGDIWASGSNGLYRYSVIEGIFKYYDDFHDELGLANEPLSIAHDGTSLWVGHGNPNFVAKIKNDTALIYDRNQGVFMPVSDIEIDKEGTVWFGGPDGLFSLDTDTFKDRLAWIQGHVNEMSIDHLGNLILAHSGRIFKHGNGKWTIYGNKEGLRASPWTVENSDSNDLIIGSWTKGIEYVFNEQHLLIDRSLGVDNHINSISHDPYNNLWVRTNAGLNVLNTENIRRNMLDKSNLQVDELCKLDGINSISFSAHMDDVIDGDSIWFSNGAGIHILDYEEYSKSSERLNLIFTEIQVNDRRINYNQDSIEGISFDIPSAYSNIPRNLSLDYRYNDLLFEFCNASFEAPHANNYRYRIKELDVAWSRASSLNQANFTNLPPGDFTFQVQVLGHGFIWSKPLSYRFKILPPWYRTGVAYVSYMLLLIGLVMGFSRWQNQRLQHENFRLESIVSERTSELQLEKQKSDDLLLNILPLEIASELKATGTARARSFENISILFSDMVGFTGISEKLEAGDLVELLNECFKAFDDISLKYGVEKIKTIGDAYMAAGGLKGEDDSAINTVKCALEMQDFIKELGDQRKAEGKPWFDMRIGIHTGHVVAGIVGLKKFQYDIWGDAVNTAFRIEEVGEPGKVNLSVVTYELVKSHPAFQFESRGKIPVKGKSEIEMYFVSRT